MFSVFWALFWALFSCRLSRWSFQIIVIFHIFPRSSPRWEGREHLQIDRLLCATFQWRNILWRAPKSQEFKKTRLFWQQRKMFRFLCRAVPTWIQRVQPGSALPHLLHRHRFQALHDFSLVWTSAEVRRQGKLLFYSKKQAFLKTSILAERSQCVKRTTNQMLKNKTIICGEHWWWWWWWLVDFLEML